MDCGVLKNCNMTTCNFVDWYNMKVACFCEMLTPIYNSAWYHILKDTNLIVTTKRN
jgi:hypothetical protein